MYLYLNIINVLAKKLKNLQNHFLFFVKIKFDIFRYLLWLFLSWLL